MPHAGLQGFLQKATCPEDVYLTAFSDQNLVTLHADSTENCYSIECVATVQRQESNLLRQDAHDGVALSYLLAIHSLPFPANLLFISYLLAICSKSFPEGVCSRPLPSEEGTP